MSIVSEKALSVRLPLALLLMSLAASSDAGSAAAARADGHWTVSRGETLYAIARALAPHDGAAQRRLRAALLRANPNAFVGGDAARLATGAKLRLPGPTVAARPVDAKRTPTTPVAATPPATAQPQAAGAPAVTSTSPTPTSQAQTTVVPVPAARAIPVSTAPRRPAAGARSATLIAVTGKVVAVTSDRRRWPLRRGAHVYSGDHIVTATGARAQLRFTDGGLISLRSNTEFAIEDYRFNGKIDGQERGFFGLLRGGLRTLSGLIGKIRHKSYRMRTPLATIGIRGTDYALFICTGGACRTAPDAGGQRTALPDGLWGGVVAGRIVARTEVAEVSFPREQFFHIVSARSVPRRVLRPPAVLLQPIRAIRRRAPAQQQTASGTAGGKRASGSSAATAARRRVALRSLRPATAITATGLGAGTVATLPSAVLSGLTAVGAPRFVAGAQALARGLAQDTSLSRAPPGSAVIGRFLTRPASGAAGTRSDGGPVVDVGSAADQIFLGQQGQAANIPRAVITTDSGGQPGGGLNCQPCTFSAGGATLVDVGGAGGPGLGINWGRWAGNYFASENGTRLNTVGSLHFIFSPNLTSPSQLGAQSGSATFNTVLGGTTPIDEQGGSYTVSNVSVAVNFGTRQVTNYSFDLTGAGGRSWTVPSTPLSVNFGQAFNGEIPLSGGCTGCGGTSATGNASLLFVGPTAQRAISGFGLTDSSGASVTGTMAVAQP